MIGLLATGAVHAETLRTVQAGNVSQTINPYSSLPQGITNPHAMMHDMLANVATDGTPVPGLAISWEVTSPTTWIFDLRPDVRYSNGRPFNADSFIKSITYLKSDAAQRYVVSGEVRTIKEVRKIDDLTVEIETNGPDVLLPRRFGMIPLPEPYLYDELGPDEFSLAPIGTGSYVMDAWNLDSQKPVLVANMDSWRAPVEIDRVEMRLVKDPATQVQGLLSEEADIGYNFGVLDIELLESAGYRIEVHPGGQISALLFSNRDPDSPFSDQRVRQALNYAVDMETIADIIMMGTTRPAGQPGIATMTGFNSSVVPYPYDPDKARALLAEAGYSDGFSFRADVLAAGGAVESTTIYLKMAQDLAAVGVDMEVQPVQGMQWIQRYFSGDWGEAEVMSGTWNGAAYWDVVRAIEIFSCKKPGAFFCEPDMVPTLEATHGMFDPEERSATLQELSKQMHDLAPSLFMMELVDIVAINPKFGPMPFRHKQLAVDQLRLATKTQ